MGHKSVVCFGEVLLRLSAPGHERLLQSNGFETCFGGAEANVAVCLSRLGHKAGLATILPDNDLGVAARAGLVGHGVELTPALTRPGRLGLYFFEAGAVLRPSKVLYDRDASAFVQHAGEIDWEIALNGASWLHVSGITPATGSGPSQAAIKAVETAAAMGISVSFDGNYRAQLWQRWQGDGPAVLRQILASTSLAFINERDIGLLLGQTFSSRKQAQDGAFEAFPNLKAMAATTRQQDSVNDQVLCGEYVTRDGRWVSREYPLVGVVDRIGGGDAFAAGVLHGLLEGHAPQDLIEFAVACGAIKHSIPGDFCLTSRSEVDALAAGSGLDVRR
jgi:2-dehydro-3-deoxygluconokinase